MAKRKTAAKPKKQFLAFSTDCGSFSQVERLPYYTPQTTLAAAQKEAERAYSDAREYGDISDGCSIVLVEVVNVAKSTGITWSGETAIDE